MGHHAPPTIPAWQRPADFYGLTDHAQGGLVVQPDGKLVAAGASFTGGSYDFALPATTPTAIAALAGQRF